MMLSDESLLKRSMGMVKRRKSRKKPSPIPGPVKRTCYCEGHCPEPDVANGTCVLRAGGKCFAEIQDFEDDGEEYTLVQYGCLPPGEGSLMQCKSSQAPHHHSKGIQCCDDFDMCNRNLKPIYAPRPTTDPPTFGGTDSLPYTVLLASVTFCLSVLLLAIAFVFIKYRRKNGQSKFNLYSKDYHPSQKYANLEVHGPLANLIEKSSGSGAGLPILVQRTISKQVQMIRPVGKGRYGEVWLGSWRSEKVAVKVFLTSEERSWFRETEIYQTVLMRHENILSFIAADIKGNGWTQMLLITDYHENGSLYDYLQNHCLDVNSLLIMARSLASGLSHLHTEIFSTKGKPAIAHRDLKSKNILVKRDGEVCIADFGLAVKFISESNELDLPSNIRSGTKRYMAPEILDKTINVNEFEAHKKADIYALGLVFWEMSRRCATGDKIKMVDDYAAPYYDCVPNDPTFEDMQQVVCVKNIRPQIPQRWESEEVLQTLTKVMTECWHASPEVRLTSLRVKKTLSKLEPDISIKIV